MIKTIQNPAVFTAAVNRCGFSHEAAPKILGLSSEDFEKMAIGTKEITLSVWKRLSMAYWLHEQILSASMSQISEIAPSEEDIQKVALKAIGERIPQPLAVSIIASMIMARFQLSNGKPTH